MEGRDQVITFSIYKFDNKTEKVRDARKGKHVMSLTANNNTGRLPVRYTDEKKTEGAGIKHKVTQIESSNQPRMVFIFDFMFDDRKKI